VIILWHCEQKRSNQLLLKLLINMLKYVSLGSLYYDSLPLPPRGPQYGNMTSDGEPVPGLSRGVVPYQRDYVTTRPARNSWYDRLQLIRPLAMDWLRNAWGNVDEFGRHVYDVMQRVRHVFVPYDKLGNLPQGDAAGSGVERNNTYSTMKRPALVILPTESENASTTENVWSIRLSKYRTLVYFFIETYLLFPIIFMIDCSAIRQTRNIIV
jgi:hypothetical protein